MSLSHEHFVLAVADGNAASIAQPGRDQPIRMALAEHNERAGAAQIMERAAHGPLQVAGAAVDVMAVDQMDDHLCVGLTAKYIAFGLQFLAQFQEVLHDAVLHHDQVALCAAVGMGVALAGRPMSGPARMADADPAMHRSFFDQAAPG